jgi:hypothetical protein
MPRSEPQERARNLTRAVILASGTGLLTAGIACLVASLWYPNATRNILGLGLGIGGLTDLAVGLILFSPRRPSR